MERKVLSTENSCLTYTMGKCMFPLKMNITLYIVMFVAVVLPVLQALVLRLLKPVRVTM